MLIRVLEIPPYSGNFHHLGGEPTPFIEVDWFRDDQEPPMMANEDGREQISDFIKGKKYFDPEKAYLVLHQNHPFTIGYSAP